MEAFVWDERFCTGIASVDEQHRRLVDMVNRVGDMLLAAEELPEAEIKAVFLELADYARFHFADEERVMAEAGLDPRARGLHVSQHHGFVEQLTALWQAHEGMQRPAESLHGFLSAWLTFHILGEDQSMARQIRRIGEGASCDQAYAQETAAADTPTAVLLSALKSLYGVLSLQNRDLARSNQALTDKVEARTRELLHAEKMASIGQLAAGVAHEINNPVGFVSSNLASLRRYTGQLLELAALGAGTEEGKARFANVDLDYLRSDIGDLLDESAAGLQRISKIVRDLKDFSQVDEADWQDADLQHALESTLTVVGHRLKEKAELVLDLQTLPKVRCVPAQINQVFMNLLVNAAQAIATRGVITVSNGVEGNVVWFEVQDTGSGMDEKTRLRIFDPFFTTKPVGTGTGLGLSVSWEIVQRHKGSLQVSSTPGCGSCFRLTLPIAGPGA